MPLHIYFSCCSDQSYCVLIFLSRHINGHLSKPKIVSQCSVNGLNENASDGEGEMIQKSYRFIVREPLFISVFACV